MITYLTEYVGVKLLGLGSLLKRLLFYLISVFMTKLARSLLVVCVISLGLVGCAPVYLAPIPNTPLFAEKGESSVALQAGSSGGSIQAAYAPLNHFSIMGAGSWDFIGGNHRHTYGELGLGSFLSSESSRWRAEVYAGGGLGRSAALHEYELWLVGPVTRQRSGHYERAFVQMQGGWVGRHVEAGLTARIAYVWYHFSEINLEPTSETQQQIFFEPALFLRVGSEAIKYEMTAGFVRPLRGYDTAPQLDYIPMFSSMGVRIDLRKVLGGL